MNTPRTSAATLTEPYQVRELPFEVVRASDMEQLETELVEVTKERDAIKLRNDTLEIENSVRRADSFADQQSARQANAERDELKAKLEKCRAAFGGISEYGKMCKGTDVARMKYLADQAIDHIIPCAHFDLTDINQRRICFHYTNIQPMSAAENIRKGKPLPKPHQAIMI